MKRGARHLLVLAALLPGCAGGSDPAPRRTEARARPPAAAPAGPPDRFDGRYVGTVSLQPDRTRRCPEPPAVERELTVRNGRASFMFNPQVRQVLTGTVGSEGSVRMADSLDRTIATSGVFDANGVFQGEHRSGLCSYSVRMTKRDG